jgi:c-di-GMP-binding flagellar brake protein YcgR
MKSDDNSVSVRSFGFRAPRVSANFSFSLEVVASGERYEAVCTDISEDGMAAEVLQPLAPKTTVTIRMLLPGDIAPLQIPGSVEYSQDGRCGLNFLDSPAEDRRQIQQFIQSIT